MLAEAITPEVSASTSTVITVLAILFLIPALGILVKWWMKSSENSIKAVGESAKEAIAKVASDTEKSITALGNSTKESIAGVARSVERLSYDVIAQAKATATLEVHRENHAKEIEQLRSRVEQLQKS